MSTSPFLDDYSSEDYSDHDDDYYFVPAATSPRQQVRAQVDIQTDQSNELQNLIIDQQEDVSESVYFDVVPELEAETAEEEGGGMKQSIYLAVESYFDTEAEAKTGVAAAALEAETPVEELAVGSSFVLEAQVETDVAAPLEAETVVEKLTVGSSFVLEAQVETGVAAPLEAETVVEKLTVGSSFVQLEAQVETDVAAPLEAETVVEKLTVGSSFVLEAQVETDVAAPLEAETVLEEGDVIESESLKTVEADTAVETVESMIEEFIYEAVESESDLEAENAIEEPSSDVEHEADVAAPEAETAVEEEDVIGESIYEAVESDYDLEAEAEDMVEEEDNTVQEEEDMVEGEDDMVEEEDKIAEEDDDFVKEGDDMVEEEAAVEEEHDVIYEPLESNSDLQAEEPEALAEPGVSIEMITFKAQEAYSDLEPEEPEDLIDEKSVSCEEESDLSEEEWDSDADEIDMDSSDSDLTEEEKDDDVVVSYLKSSTTIGNKAWKSLVPAWVKFPVTDTTTLEDSSLMESFRGCGPLLMLQGCGNAVMNAIETFLRELLRIRNDLRRVLGALFRKRETTKHA